MIEQTKPLLGETERQAVDDYLRSGGWLTEFKKTKEFEERLAAFLGVKHCIVVTSGTTALTLACMVFSGTDNSVVIVPDMTMIATANAVLLAGMNVAFCDIAKPFLCLDEFALTRMLDNNPNISGVVYVDFNGRSDQLQRIKETCQQRGVFLIEDACQALGSKAPDGNYLGTFGDIGCFSLSPHKLITTGQGGFLVTNNDFHAEKIRQLKDFGRRASGVDDHINLGFNFKFTDLQAVIGLAQMGTIDWKIERKKQIYDRYYVNLNNRKNVRMIKRLDEQVPWFVDLYADVDMQPNYVKTNIMVALDKRKIGYRDMYPPIHTQAPYRTWVSCPVSEEISRDGLWLPTHLELTDEQIDEVCECILNG
jgi:perosamine synthetase